MNAANEEFGLIVISDNNNSLLKSFEGLLFKFAHKFG